MNEARDRTARPAGVRRALLLGASLSLVLMPLAGCAEKDPFLALEAQRSQYTAQAQGFYVDERVIETDPVLDASGNEVSIEPNVEKDILLDILVKSEADDALAGLTVDLEHVDSTGNLKASHRFFLETGDVRRGTVGTFSEKLVNVDFTEGDGFTVNVRSPVPEAERSEYREFDGVGGS